MVCSELGKGATSEPGKYICRAANVWWRCAQYFVIASCGKMHRDNRLMHMAHVCFMSVVVTGGGIFCGNVCCVAAVVKNSEFF